jgi:uncharacterized RDD family membrane protein YckC
MAQQRRDKPEGHSDPFKGNFESAEPPGFGPRAGAEPALGALFVVINPVVGVGSAFFDILRLNRRRKYLGSAGNPAEVFGRQLHGLGYLFLRLVFGFAWFGRFFSHC